MCGVGKKSKMQSMGFHPFAYVMIGTFLLAVGTMLTGVAGLGQRNKTGQQALRSNRLMALRVGLCALLLAQIIIYVTYIKA